MRPHGGRPRNHAQRDGKFVRGMHAVARVTVGEG